MAVSHQNTLILHLKVFIVCTELSFGKTGFLHQSHTCTWTGHQMGSGGGLFTATLVLGWGQTVNHRKKYEMEKQEKKKSMWEC